MAVIPGIADSIKALITGLSVGFTANGAGHSSTVKGHVWGPAGFDSLPAGVVELPAIDRVGIDEAESQLGTRDFNLEFPVTFYFDVGEVAYTQAEAIAVVEAFIEAVDANPSLGDPTVIDTKVTRVDRPELDRDQSRVVLRYPTTVEVLKLV